KSSEDALKENPKNAEALSWHGLGSAYLGGQAFQAGDMTTGSELWERGQKETDDAVDLEPENVLVVELRGSMLLAATKNPLMPPDMAAPLIEKGVGDYEKILAVLKDDFTKRDAGYRGRILIGLADGWDREGKTDKARTYYERIVKELPDSDFA